MAGVPSVHFLADFSIWDFRSFISLGRGKRSVFRLTVVLPAYRIMELLQNKVFDKKKIKKETKMKNNFAFSTSSGFELW